METMNTETTATKPPKTYRFNGVCKGCGRKHTSTSTGLDCRGYNTNLISSTRFVGVGDSGYDLIGRCQCGKALRLKRVLGKFVASKKCDGRCLSATGHSCECACGGKNHGAGHAE